MDISIVVQALSFILAIGIIYGSFNARLKTIEKQLGEHKDISERLARIEEQTKLLLDHFLNRN
jgi:uncharacterized protein YneF (UPF0154 family)